MNTPNKTDAIHTLICSLAGVPEEPMTEKESKAHMTSLVSQFLKPFQNRPMVLVQSEVLTALTELNVLLFLFLFRKPSDAKALWNVMNEQVLEALSDPEIIRGAEACNEAVRASRGEAPTL